jgi:two-component system KDP operon response regulator KdpE
VEYQIQINAMKKILVVDDETEIVTILQRFLQLKQYDVTTATNGTQALEKVREERPDVVLLDINMPGKTGLEVLKEIHAFDSSIGVIMVTAQTDEESGRFALSHGAFDYITKPFDFEDLEKVLWWKLQLMD